MSTTTRLKTQWLVIKYELEFYAYDLIECDLSVTDKMAYIANSTPFKIADTATFDKYYNTERAIMALSF